MNLDEKILTVKNVCGCALIALAFAVLTAAFI